jgi:hypothetical protein
MKLTEWRKKQVEELELPSGLTATVRRVRLVDLAARGSVPTPLAGAVSEMLRGKKFDAASVADYAEYGKLVDLVVSAAVIAPPVAPTSDDEHLGLDELTLEDKTAIFNWAHSEGDRLDGFRAEPERDAVAGAVGGEVSHAPQ